MLAELLSPELGQAVVVDNRPGAGSAIGVGLAAQSRDGHTLLMGSNSMLINPALNPQIGYDLARDFDAIAMVSAQPLVLVVPRTSDLTSLAALVAAAKAEPGRLMAGNSGNGTLAHIDSRAVRAARPASGSRRSRTRARARCCRTCSADWCRSAS